MRRRQKRERAILRGRSRVVSWRWPLEFPGLAVQAIAKRKSGKFDAQPLHDQAGRDGLIQAPWCDRVHREGLDKHQTQHVAQSLDHRSNLHPQLQHGARLLPEIAHAELALEIVKQRFYAPAARIQPIDLAPVVVAIRATGRLLRGARHQRIVDDQCQHIAWQHFEHQREQPAGQTHGAQAAAPEKLVVSRPVPASRDGADSSHHPAIWRNHTAAKQLDKARARANRHGRSRKLIHSDRHSRTRLDQAARRPPDHCPMSSIF